MRGHVAIITETESKYVRIESNLQFDDVEDIPGLLPLLRVVQRSRMRSREWSGRRPRNEAIVALCGTKSQAFIHALLDKQSQEMDHPRPWDAS